MGTEIDNGYKMKYKPRNEEEKNQDDLNDDKKQKKEEEKNKDDLNEDAKEKKEEEKNQDDLNDDAKEKKEEDKKDESNKSEVEENKKENKKDELNKSEKEEEDKKDESNKSGKGEKIEDSLGNKEEENKIETIKVKINIEGGYWEKEYNIETQLNQIKDDFIKENNFEKLKKNRYIEFNLNNKPLQMDSDKIISLIYKGQKELILNQKLKVLPGTEKNDIIKEEQVEYIGKPFSNPFEIYIFEIGKKIIKKIKYGTEKARKLELDKFGIDSSYCNGNNYLFISGGIDPINKKEINLFWIFDLKKNSPKNIINMPLTKKNHSMIYINKKVYIIGGNDGQTMYYDTIKENIEIWINLNKKKYEPSLIKYENYLFCIDSSKKFSPDNYNFERINLIEENPLWEEINPQINYEVSNLIFSQKFFGLVEDNNDNIIFIGGIYGDNNNINDDDIFNLQYNINDNLIEKSNINIKNNEHYKNINLKEKAFVSYNENIYVIFPDFVPRAPKILYYYKDKNYLEVNLYHSNQKLTKIYNKARATSLKENLKNVNFNMPLKNIYSSNQPFNNLNPAYNAYLGIKQKNDYKIKEKDKPLFKEKNILDNNISNFDNINIKFNNINNKENNSKNNNIYDNNNIINNNNNITIDKKSSNNFHNSNILDNNNTKKEIDQNNNISKEINNKENNIEDNKEKNNINSFDKISNNKSEINKEEDIKKNNNDNLDNIKSEEDSKKSKTKSNKDSEGKNEEDNNNIVEEKKSQKDDNEDNKEEKKEIEEKISKKEEAQKDNEEEKISNKEEEQKDNEEEKKSNKEVEQKDNEEEKKEDEGDKKIDISNKSVNEDDNKKIKEKSTTNIELYDYDKTYSLATFHSSVNNNIIINFGKLSNNKAIKENIKKSYIYQPNDVNIKTLKKARRQFNRFEMNEFRDNNNY